MSLLARGLLIGKKSQFSHVPKPPFQERTRLVPSTLAPADGERFPVIPHMPLEAEHRLVDVDVLVQACRHADVTLQLRCLSLPHFL